MIHIEKLKVFTQAHINTVTLFKASNLSADNIPAPDNQTYQPIENSTLLLGM